MASRIFFGFDDSGAVSPAAAAASTLPKLTSAATVTEAQSNAGASSMPKLRSAATAGTGRLVTGASTLPRLTSAGIAREKVIAAAASVLPMLTSAGTVTNLIQSAAVGVSAAEFYTPAGGVALGLTPVLIDWETHRYLNRVGSWAAKIPVSQPLVSSQPLARAIQRGWRLNLTQEGVHPYNLASYEWLLYQGMVEDKEFDIDESGGTVCQLRGSFRGIELASRVTPTTASYTDEAMDVIMADIEDGLLGGVTTPANSTRRLSIAFGGEDSDGVISRYQRWLKVAELARWSLREKWQTDGPEFIANDAPPSSGYTFTSTINAAAGRAPGVGLIAGSPHFRREGRGIVNRIIPFGVDTITRIDDQSETTLTLAEDRYNITPADPPLLTIDTQPTAGQTLTVAGTPYTFISGSTNAAGGQIAVGVSLGAAQSNIIDAINGTDGFNNPNLLVRTALGWSGNTLRLLPIHPGSEDNTPVVTGDVLSSGGNGYDEGDLGQASEIVEVPLTLEHSTRSFPYIVQSGDNDDGTSYWYIEDAESIATYGLVEQVIHRTDIKNPSDDTGTRAAAADVLYAVAYGELLKNKAPKLFVEVDIGNGYDVWALPGDRVKLQYTGYVTLDSGVEIWEEFDDWFLVVERHDKSTDSGVREVKFALAAPEIVIDIPGLPEALALPTEQATPDPDTSGGEPGSEDDPSEPNVSLPVITPDPFTTLMPPLGLPTAGGAAGPNWGNGGGSLYPSCCTDRTTIATGLPDDGNSTDIPFSWLSFETHLFHPLEGSRRIGQQIVDIAFISHGGSVDGTDITAELLATGSGTWMDVGVSDAIGFSLYVISGSSPEAEWTPVGHAALVGRFTATKDIPNGFEASGAIVVNEYSHTFNDIHDPPYHFSAAASTDIEVDGAPLDGGCAFVFWQDPEDRTDYPDPTLAFNGGTYHGPDVAAGTLGDLSETVTATAGSVAVATIPGLIPYPVQVFIVVAAAIIQLNPETP